MISGNHEAVAVINNYVEKEDVYYFKAVADAKIITEGKRDFVQTVLSLPIF